MTRIEIIKVKKKILNQWETKSTEEMVEETNEFLERKEKEGFKIISISTYRQTNNPSIDSIMIVYAKE